MISLYLLEIHSLLNSIEEDISKYGSILNKKV